MMSNLTYPEMMITQDVAYFWINSVENGYTISIAEHSTGRILWVSGYADNGSCLVAFSPTYRTQPESMAMVIPDLEQCYELRNRFEQNQIDWMEADYANWPIL